MSCSSTFGQRLGDRFFVLDDEHAHGLILTHARTSPAGLAESLPMLCKRLRRHGPRLTRLDLLSDRP